MKTIYLLDYEDDKCYYRKIFSKKKELDKFIKTLPKELKYFDVTRNKVNSGLILIGREYNLNKQYIKEEINKVILK